MQKPLPADAKELFRQPHHRGRSDLSVKFRPDRHGGVDNSLSQPETPIQGHALVMDWIDLVGSAEFLRKLFPSPPSLRGLRVLEVDLHQDGPRALIKFDLNEFPEQPPAKWMQSHANKVQVRLMGIGVRDLEVRGWSANNVADIQILAAGSDGVRFVATGPGFYFNGVFEHLAVDSVSAYTDAAA